MGGKNKKNIIWLASYPKSGNTWFRVFLSNIFSGSDKPVNINSLHPNTIASNRQVFEDYTGISSSELTENEIRALRPKIYRLMSEDNESALYVKVHDAWQLNDQAIPLFPNEVTKAVIYIIRNPFDVAKSYANHNAISLSRAIEQLNSNTGAIGRSAKNVSYQFEQILLSWSEHVISWVELSKLPVLVIRYEDLISDPLMQFRTAVDFLGISASDHQIAFAVQNSDFKILVQQEEKFGFKEKPQKSPQFFHSGIATDLNQLVGNKYYESLKAHHAEIMKQYNYFI